MELKLLNAEEYEYYLESLNKLFSMTFEREIHPEYLRWRYLQNPSEDLLVAVAIENNEIVANYSASPCSIIFNGQTYKTALSMTTMTHPEYNGRGLFTKLADLLYLEMKKRGYSLIWGFPNNNSHGIFKSKLGWEDIYEIPTFKLELSKTRDILIEKTYTLELDNTFENFKAYPIRRKIQVEKSKEFYKWRYTNNPINEYFNCNLKYLEEYKANIVYKNFGDSVDIVEIEGESDEFKLILLQKLILELKDQGKRDINCWLNISGNLHNLLERIGFYNTSPITYFGGKNLGGNLEICNYKIWDISMGDSDVY
ncbi:GNAT family N-acetyltransferase [Metasolibacillus fluoroglycofenilyticus]|uniref:GNAT family N-acetyltransferase n=1 Tax=Metasolibacillus fluoroglycofenilyticus TaxID=1239396 RepID=UPI000D39D459|nr:GNAT family N-acetyltransferase [Metasolibacillus fluoroglycofenilyticus]